MRWLRSLSEPDPGFFDWVEP